MYHSVFHFHDSMTVSSNLILMSNDNEGVALAVQFVEQLHDFHSGS